MKILVIGDITSPSAAEQLAGRLWDVRRSLGVDAVIANAENAGFITGAAPDTAELLFRGGVDVLTGGNHTLRNKRSHTFLEECDSILRPINFGGGAPGRGYTFSDVAGYRMLVINAMGTVHVDPTLDSPFRFIEDVLERERGEYDVSVLDIHAEATGEKLAIAHHFDGRLDVVFGTHTHVQTADEQILPHGTGYITDVGMCGESGGILGIETSSVIESIRTHLPPKFAPATGKVVADAALFTVEIGKGTTKVERLKI